MKGHLVDRTNWPAGPWDSEADNEDFTHAGLNCYIRRVPNLGHLCGYVAVPKGHHLFGWHCDDMSIEVHGGLTFSQEVDGEWVFGFDCAHAGDLTPGTPTRYWRDGIYRNFEYVRGETRSLAKQIATYPAEVLPTAQEFVRQFAAASSWDHDRLHRLARRLARSWESHQ